MQTRNYVKLHSVTLGERGKVSNIFYCDFEDVSVIEENFAETEKNSLWNFIHLSVKESEKVIYQEINKVQN